MSSLSSLSSSSTSSLTSSIANSAMFASGQLDRPNTSDRDAKNFPNEQRLVNNEPDDLEGLKANLDEMILSPRKLLDKLIVQCPNVDYCLEILPLHDLQAHLIYRCKGATAQCVNACHGCNFESARVSLKSHLQDCLYHRKSQFQQSLPVRTESETGEQVNIIQIYRGGSSRLGISIVGGIDTPLVSVIVQSLHKNGAASRDGRLSPGDQLLEVNGVDLTRATHLQAVRVLSKPCIVCELVIFREPVDDCLLRKKDIATVTLQKLADTQLGIKLVQKQHLAGLYILEIIPGGVAYWDDQLKPDDHILKINDQDMTFGTQEQAVNIIKNSVDTVEFVVSRLSASATMSTSSAHLASLYGAVAHGDDSNDGQLFSHSSQMTSWDKVINIRKRSYESLGITIAGGLFGESGYDAPIYITNMQPDGCLAKTNQILKGDILLSINGISLLHATQEKADQVLKLTSECTCLTIHILQGTETSDGPGNFKPSWKYWLSMPSACYSVKLVELERSAFGSLGFSIVGGYSSQFGSVPIYIRSVVPHSPAGKDGRLRSGDMILSVNDVPLDGATHGDAVQLLTSEATDHVVLTVVSWPGSSV